MNFCLFCGRYNGHKKGCKSVRVTGLVAALLFVTLLPTPAHAALLPREFIDAWAQQPTTVTVQPGDVLSELFADTPGGWPRAAKTNRLTNPHHLEVGQVLEIPLRDGPRWQPPPSPEPEHAWTSAASQPSSSAPAGSSPTSSAGLNWTALFECESGNNPRAVSPSGAYRGLAQFDLATWASVGMSGDPIDHSYAVQAEAARRLYAARGRSPWPHCGGLL